MAGHGRAARLLASRSFTPENLNRCNECGACLRAGIQRQVSRLPDRPPFGNLYDMPVFADESLTRDKEIAFNAGSHLELIRMAWNDFERLVKPRIERFATGGIESVAA